MVSKKAKLIHGVSSQVAGACGGETVPGRRRRGPPGGGSHSDR